MGSTNRYSFLVTLPINEYEDLRGSHEIDQRQGS